MKARLTSLPVAALAGVLLICTAPSAPAQAVVAVSTLADSGPGSLRAAIASAHHGDRITFTVAGTIGLTHGPLLLDKDLTLAGPDPAGLAVSGNRSSRVFTVSSNAVVVIFGLTIRDGKASDGAPGSEGEPGGPGAPGGGVYNAGTLTLSNCVITSNSAGDGGLGGATRAGGPGGLGGGIYSPGTLTLISCILSSNFAGRGGNGAVARANEAGNAGGPGGDGGAIHSGSLLALSQCLLAGNGSGGGGSGSSGYGPSYPASGDGWPGGAGGQGGHGGAIHSAGRLTIDNCRVSTNRSGSGGSGGRGGGGGYSGNGARGGAGGLGGGGGGIYNAGFLALSLSTLQGNAGGTGGSGGNGGNAGLHFSLSGLGGFGGGGGAGGGIFNGSTASMSCSTISLNGAGSAGLGGDRGMPGSGTGNRAYPGAGGVGGGLHNAGPLVLTNCTFSGNVGGNGFCGGSGGGIYHHAGDLELRSCTLSSNATGGPLPESPYLLCANDGGGIASGGGGTVVLFNSLVAQNIETGLIGAPDQPDVAGPFISLGHNLIGITNGGSGFTGTDRVGSLAAPLNPRLGPLADNGGPNGTHAVLPGSPAIDTGDNTEAPATDQRGLPRVVCGLMDVGAFETQSCQPGIRGIHVGPDRSCQLEFNGAPMTTYTLQASTNLAHWTDLTPLPAGPTGLFGYCDATATNHAQRFFRLRSP